MPVYATCCCVEEEGVPCASTSGECPPVAILVEGHASVGINASYGYEATRNCTCGICESYYSVDNLYTQSANVSTFATVHFKALLVRPSFNSGDRYFTTGDYPSITSVSGGHSSDFEDTSSYDDSECADPCTGAYSDYYIRARQERTPDDVQLSSFSMSRTTSFEQCEPGTPNCLIDVHGEGCYEKYEIIANVNIPVNTFGESQKQSFRRQRNPFTQECNDDIELIGNYPHTECEGATSIPWGVSMTRYARIRPEEAEQDVCPLDMPRTISGIDVNRLRNEATHPDDSCEQCGPCECAGDGRSNMQYVPDGGYVFTDYIPLLNCPYLYSALGYSYRPLTFQAPKCLGFRDGDITQTNDSWDDQVQLNCNEEKSSCIDGGMGVPSDNDCPSDNCTGQTIKESGPCPEFFQVNYSFSSSVAFQLDRHELLYELPDPAVWPNV